MTQSLTFIDSRAILTYVGKCSGRHRDRQLPNDAQWQCCDRPAAGAQLYSPLGRANSVPVRDIVGQVATVWSIDKSSNRSAETPGLVPLEWTIRYSEYPGGYFALAFEFHLAGAWFAAQLTDWINTVFSGTRLIMNADLSVFRLSDYARDLSQRFSGDHQRVPSGVTLIEYYSTIVPEALAPAIVDPVEQLPESLIRELLLASVRRMPSFDHLDLSYSLQIHEDLSVYTGDYVSVYYHNTLVYVSDSVNHLPASFYYHAVEVRKIYVAVLRQLDEETSGLLEKVGRLPRGIRKLAWVTRNNGQRIVDYIRWKDMFRAAESGVATRSKWLDEGISQALDVHRHESVLEDKLATVSDVIGTRYDLAMQGTLQLVTIALTILSVVVAMLGLQNSSILTRLALFLRSMGWLG